jgi:creatinine amidohydrolase
VGEEVYRWRSFASRTATGVIGDAALASAEKGERLLRAAADAVAKAVTTQELWTLPK